MLSEACSMDSNGDEDGFKQKWSKSGPFNSVGLCWLQI